MVVRGRNEIINYEDKKEDAIKYKVSCSRSEYDMIRICPPRETNKQTNKQTNKHWLPGGDVRVVPHLIDRGGEE